MLQKVLDNNTTNNIIMYQTLGALIQTPISFGRSYAGMRGKIATTIPNQSFYLLGHTIQFKNNVNEIKDESANKSFNLKENITLNNT